MAKTKTKTVSAIIPAYNEEKTAENVVKTAIKSKIFREVICINDASTDNTLKILQKFGKRIVLINFSQNKGKTGAIAVGIKISRSEVVMFIDSDLLGLKTKHLDKLFKYFINNKLDGVLASLDSPLYINSLLSFITLSRYDKRYDPITGERIYYKKDLLPHLNSMKSLGYGLEVYLNDLFKNKKIGLIKFDGVTHLFKNQKTNRKWYWGLWLDLFKEIGDVTKQLVKQNVRS